MAQPERRGPRSRERAAAVPARRAIPAPVRRRPAALAFLVGAALAAVVIAAYRGALANGFSVLDDWAYVTQNPLVLGRHYGELLRAVVSNNYHPLTLVTLAWNVGTPLSPGPFILTNVLLHAVDTVLVFGLAWLLSGRRLAVAAFVALVFGIHPMHVESVAWISERKDVLHALFYLGAAIAYWLHLERGGARLLVVAFALFVLSCLSKGMAVSFPLAMIALDLWKRRPLLERRAVLEKLPFFAVALLFGAIAVDVQAGGDFHGLLRAGPEAAGVIRSAMPYSTLQRAVLPAAAAAGYLWHLFVPVGMAAFHPYPSPAEAGRAPYLLAPLAWAALVALAAWDLRRSRILAFGIAWYLATVVLVLQWIPVGMALSADRYTYLPYIGLAFAWAMGMDRIAARRRWLRVVLWGASAVFALLLFVQTTRQVTTWRDGETLWTRVVQVHPRSGQGYASRGNARLGAGRMTEAVVDLRTALRLGNRSAQLFDGLGSVEGMLGHPDSALVMFDRAIAADAGQGSSYFNRALVKLQLGRLGEVIQDLDRALELVPTMAPRILALRGFTFTQLGEFRAGAAAFDRAIAAGARDADTFSNRGFCRLRLGDRAGAAEDFRQALRLDPGHVPAAGQLRGMGRDTSGSEAGDFGRVARPAR
jgi:Tfp pilus assembly protein PilF